MPVTAASSTRPSPGPARLPDVHILAGPVTEESDADVLAVPLVAGRDGEAAVRLGHGGAEVAAAVGIDLLRMAVRERPRARRAKSSTCPCRPRVHRSSKCCSWAPATGRRRLPAGRRRARPQDPRAQLARHDGHCGCRRRGGASARRGAAPWLLLLQPQERRQAPAALAAAGLVASGATAPQAVHRATTVARATAIARDLANTPSNEKAPQWLAEQAVRLGDEAGLSVRVRDEAALAAEGLGGVVAVGTGSARPPRVVELRYTPVPVAWPRTSSWSARASPSTPVGCRSSHARRWCR